MSLSGRIQDWLSGYSLGMPEYRCQDCGRPINGDGDSCPECGGDLTDVEVTPEYEWGPLY